MSREYAPTYHDGGRSVPMTLATIDQLANGALQLSRLGRTVPYKLNRAQATELTSAKQRGYVITHNRDRALRNLYFTWCEVTDRPFVSVDLRIQYAAVECDPISSTWEPSPHAMVHIDALWRQLAAHGGWFSSGPGFIYCNRVPIAQAEAVAAKLWRFYCEDCHDTTAH